MIKRAMRTFLLLVICAALAPTVWAQPVLAQPILAQPILAQPILAQPILQDHALIEDDVIRFGDLFQDAGKKAGIAIAKAPAPGTRIVLNAERLTRIARAYKFPWRARSNFDRVIVERSGKAIPQEAVTDALKGALRKEGAPKNMLIEFSGANFQIYVPSDQATTIAVKQLEYDKRSQNFSAVLVSPAKGPLAKKFRVNGQAHATVAIPVLQERADHGDILRKRNIQWIRMRADRVGSNIVTSARDLIGHTPHRMLLAGKPIDKNKVVRPILVKKGDIVTMSYKTSYMSLTVKGRAMDDGSKNDMIRVMNVQSKTVIDATVISPNNVTAYVHNTIATKG